MRLVARLVLWGLVALGGRPVPAHAAVFWGDLHAHSGLSNDATGTPENFFTVARDVVGLDFVVLSDHDIFITPAEWDILRMTANSFNDEGQFVAFSASEWTHLWHMNVYFLHDDQPFCPCSDAPGFNAFYRSVIEAEEAAAQVNHPIQYPVTWNTIDDAITTSIEVWNSGSLGDNEIGFGAARWAVQAGFRLGFVGVTDDHHTDQVPPLMGTGLTGCHADALTRADLLAAVRARRCYATNGERMLLDVDVDGTFMGGELSAPVHGSVTANVAVTGTDTPSAIEVLRDGMIVATKTDCAGPACAFSTPVEVRDEHTFLYARVHQPGGKTAWSSPVWVHGQCPTAANCPIERLGQGGGRPETDCLAEWKVDPVPDVRRPGARTRVTCIDGDPTCDFGTEPRECVFRIGLCLGVSDPRLPECAATPVDSYDLRRPRATARAATEVENRVTLLTALYTQGANPPAGTCTPLVEIHVPRRSRVGHRRFRGEAVAGGLVDRDSLTLVCKSS
jgi:hypothetical protein